MSVWIQIFAFIITVLILVSVHEFGHFWVAKRCGVKVLRFVIGFGKRLYSWRGRDGTEYSIGMIPLGGYVKLLDEREGPVDVKERSLAFNNQSVWVRLMIVAAGPLVNILFAIFAFWLIYTVGFKQAIPVVEKVLPNTPAARAGLKPGQQIVGINGHVVTGWQDVVLALVRRMGEKGTLRVATQTFKGSGAQKPIVVHTVQLADWRVSGLHPELLRSLGVVPYSPHIPTRITKVEPKGPAARAGLKVGDNILAVGQQSVKDWKEFVRIVQAQPSKKITVTLERQGKQQLHQVQVGRRWRWGRGWVGYIGVMPARVAFPEAMKHEIDYPFYIAPWPALKRTASLFTFNFTILGKLVMGKISMQALGGPITIYRTANQAFRQGVVGFLSFLALLSVMLAFFNVLPIPGLDGGHLFYFLIEIVRGKPISLSVETLALRLGMILLAVLLFHVTINDILRLLP